MSINYEKFGWMFVVAVVAIYVSVNVKAVHDIIYPTA